MKIVSIEEWAYNAYLEELKWHYKGEGVFEWGYRPPLKESYSVIDKSGVFIPFPNAAPDVIRNVIEELALIRRWAYLPSIEHSYATYVGCRYLESTRTYESGIKEQTTFQEVFLREINQCLSSLGKHI